MLRKKGPKLDQTTRRGVKRNTLGNPRTSHRGYSWKKHGKNNEENQFLNGGLLGKSTRWLLEGVYIYIPIQLKIYPSELPFFVSYVTGLKLSLSWDSLLSMALWNPLGSNLWYWGPTLCKYACPHIVGCIFYISYMYIYTHHIPLSH